MPCYEYFCESCRIRFERIRPMSECAQPSQCPECDFGCCEVIPSRVTMRPDNMWSGIVDPHYGYATSNSQIKARMREKGHVMMGDRADIEGMAKIAEQAREDKQKQINKKMENWANKAFGPEGLGLGGAEGNKIIRDEIESQKKGNV